VATDKQIEANRLNAQKSTGPRTPEGRAAVRLNGVTHGLTAETIVLKGESESDFKALFDSLEAEHNPASPTEETLVVQLAMAAWRLRRLYHAEAGFYSFKLKQTADNRTELKLNDAERMGYMAYLSTDELGMFNRQEARLERSFYRALHELQRLRKERKSNLASVLHATPEPENKELSADPPHSPSVSAGAEPPDMPSPQHPSEVPASDRPIR
jgi:hypothetical protein